MTTQQESQTEKSYEKMLRNAFIAYEEIYRVDVDHNYYQMVYPVTEQVKEGEYEKFLQKRFDSGKIVKEDQDQVWKFLSLKGIHENLKKDDYVERKYRRTLEREQREWFLACVTVLERQEERPTTVTIAIRSIENLFLEEPKKKPLHTAQESPEAAGFAKVDFLSRMSHDIRTPMNTIIGMTGIARSHMDDKTRVMDCLNKITVASNHLLALINEVLDMSKIDTGKMSLHNEAFYLPNLLDDLIHMVRTQVNEKNHQLDLKILHLEHKYLIGDSLRIQQVFMNMISNAIKYTPAGGKITIEVLEQPESGGDYSCFTFVFQDNGMGMSQEFVQQIFEPYVREKKAAVEKIQGTGLGMYISKNIVQMMGGDIKVESKVGIGSRFTVSIPLQYDPDQNSKRQTAQEQAEHYLEELKQADFTGKRILLAEDNDFNLEIAQEMLESTGIQVVIARDGMEAVEYFKDNSTGYFDMIFMDIQMPGLNGYEATRQIRAEEHSDAGDIPIIAMTADAFAEDVQAAKSAGMNEHIAKPLDVEKLLKTLYRWLGQ
ncbi:MAG: response regulator [Lachnospiraceae bacterium]|nr:response regulator [Lachnospiraceae bacterium]